MLGPELLGVVCALLLPGSQCEVWSPDSLENNAALYICSSATLHLFWNFSLETGETLTDVKWYYQGRSDKPIAMFSSGVFLPSPAYMQRASHSGNGGLRISHVTPDDAGVYSVQVAGHNDDGTFFTFRRSAVVHVGDDLMTEDGELHVTQSPTAVLDPSSNLWSVALLCGRFTYDEPPLQVEWLTPSGSVQASSGYSHGNFILLLSGRVEEGTYTCRVPQNYSSVACPHGNRTKLASLRVDKVEVRLTLLEAQQLSLQAENEKLKEENQNLSATLQEEDSRLNQQMRDIRQDLLEENYNLYNLNASFQRHLQAERNNAAEANVSFQARLDDFPVCYNGQVMAFSRGTTNQGGHYNPSSGIFTVPRSGTYVFLLTVGSIDSSRDADAKLMVDHQMIAHALASRMSPNVEMGSGHAVVQLSKGQQVWAECYGNNKYFWFEGTSFSGFLLRRDP